MHATDATSMLLQNEEKKMRKNAINKSFLANATINAVFSPMQQKNTEKFLLNAHAIDSNDFREFCLSDF